MGKSMKEKRKPAGKNNNIVCTAMIGYGENVIENKFGLKNVASGKKASPLSTELVAGVTISAMNGGNPNRQESR